jgi:hypothetical protein
MSTGFVSNPLGGDIGNYYQAPYTGSTNTTVTVFDPSGAATALTYLTNTSGNFGNSGFLYNGTDLSSIFEPNNSLAGGYLYTIADNQTTAGYTSLVFPTGVTSICIACVGASGGTGNINIEINSSWFDRWL